MKPWLWIPPKLAHDLSPVALQLYSAFLKGFDDQTIPVWQPLNWRNLVFPNRLGIAGGVDKDAALLSEWWSLGCGFVEVGTITPRAQSPNPGKIIDRSVRDHALWNKMGFPGGGVKEAHANILDTPRPWPTPVFANIGKNRDTSNENAHLDYQKCMNVIGSSVDGFVINISSPNTSGLRELLLPQNLKNFLSAILKARDESPTAAAPVLLKISPDMTDEEVARLAETGLALGLDGFIATNTTLARAPGSPFPPEGGVSGKPLRERSKAVLKRLAPLLGDEHLLISAGGVLSADDVFERIDLGADLVQVYTALIFEGPGFFHQVARAASTSALDLTKQRT